MGITISATIEGSKELSVELGNISTAIADFRQPLKQVSDMLLQTFDENFASAGSLLSPPGWVPRKPQMRAGARIDTWPILQKTGQLRAGFTGDLQGADTLVMSNAVPYFVYHQSIAERTRLPRRVMMKLDQTRRELIVKIFQLHIAEALRRR